MRPRYLNCDNNFVQYYGFAVRTVFALFRNKVQQLQTMKFPNDVPYERNVRNGVSSQMADVMIPEFSGNFWLLFETVRFNCPSQSSNFIIHCLNLYCVHVLKTGFHV
jgi:hypothetical protein